MNINDYINIIEKHIIDPSINLPEDIFLFISRITPLINVDLLIKDASNQTLLIWRQRGQKYKEGWHVPGGIIRYKEKIKDRINAVATNELKCSVVFKEKPIAINQIILNQKNRGHFISLLFECKLTKKPDSKIHHITGKPKIGEWSWHKVCPKNIIVPHKIYKKFF